ncbi:hypothetical protein [Brevibacillus brevis]|uniref:hypothetical protein n=1 Tax=Brevibacillus brevis TaxID=1393 RepID=UPI0037C8BCE6
MKRFIKGTITATLLLSSLSFGSSVIASSSNVDVKQQNQESQVTKGKIKKTDVSVNGLFEPFKTRKPVNGENIANNTQDDFEFDIPAGYGWVKVYVQNTGTADINVVVTDPNGNEVMSGVAKPGKPFDKKGSSGWGTGTHTVSVTSVEDMSGIVSVKLAQTKNEL